MLRFIAFLRKSQDRSDRQVMSIEGQMNEIKRLAKQNGYIITDFMIERKSAKKPGREVFNELVERLKNGEADGILCWKLNRLARNPVDAGTISWLLQGNVIKAIHSCERSYYPTDNVLMMQIDFGIANQYIKDLSSDVRRGMRDKAQSGWNPSSALPIGYIHHHKKQNSDQQIIPDPERFGIIKELWRRMETGAYSVVDICRQAEGLGLVNKVGKPYELKAFHRLFSNPMYYGKFYWKDENGDNVLWQGKHQTMISEITFRQVQRILAARTNKNAPRSYDYVYRGLITCGGCGGHVSAERKLQAICTKCKQKYSILTNDACTICGTTVPEMKNPSIIDKTYYRCTRRKDPKCRQKSISETQIENQLEEVLMSVNIPAEIYDWINSKMDEEAEKKHPSNGMLIDSMRRRRDVLNEKIRRLIDLQVSGDIDSTQARSLKNDYSREVEEIESHLFEKENALAILKKENKDYLDFAKECAERFKNGNNGTRKEIIAFFCSNLTLLDKTLYFSTKKAHMVLSLVQRSTLLK